MPSTAPPAARNGRLAMKEIISISHYDFFYKVSDEHNLERKKKRSVRGGSCGIFSWPPGLREMPAVSPSQGHCRRVPAGCALGSVALPDAVNQTH